MNRRDFLKKSAKASTVVVAGVAISNKVSKPIVANAAITDKLNKYYNSIDDLMEIKPEYKRYDQLDTAFGKSVLDDFGIKPLDSNDNPKLKHAFTNVKAGVSGVNPISGEYNPHLAGNKPGHTQLDYAFSGAGFGMEDLTGSVFARIASGDSGPALPGPDGKLIPMTLYKTDVPFEGIFKVAQNKVEFENKKDASYKVKKAAKKLGADLVGIAPYDERWIYNTEVFLPLDPMTMAPIRDAINVKRKVEFGFKPKSVIVLAFEMDYEGYKTQPSAIGSAITSMGYSRMMETSVRMSYFLRGLGYNSVHAGNNLSLSIPTAIQAGLGEGSRMGMLITEEFGPRVRLAKVYTDLELEYDKPKSFGVFEFCEVCQKCSDACPSGSISKVKTPKDPENVPQNACNNPGVVKWFNDSQKCLQFWGENWEECGVCISVCPYNKIPSWNHDLAKVLTRVPVANRLTRYLDEVFGYGSAYDEKLMTDFWKKTL